MGYYTGTIFEISSPAFPSSIAGGGRYDRMVGKLMGREAPACGFSIGFERLVAILSERGGVASPAAPAAGASGRRIALLVDDAATSALVPALAAARALREGGDLVSLEIRRKNLGRQLDDLQVHGFSAYAICEGSEPPGALAVKPLTAKRERK
jgi:histidyl-tRNA synthetase